jgi:release factor glutamine methyltransferase
MTDSDHAAPVIWDRRELLRWAADDFARRGIATARLDAELLLARALECRRVDLYLRFDECPGPEPLERFRELVKRRRAREPVAHILGTKEFHDLELAVAPGVFVPRPETEILVDEAIARLRGQDPRRTRVLDLCAGTGAIALAIALAVPGLSVQAAELDPATRDLAQQNAQSLGLNDRVTVFLGDLFDAVPDPSRFDLITCNPPYVPGAEIAGLMPEVRDHEPRLALDGGPDGLDVIRKLLTHAPARLRPGGTLIIEIGEGQEKEIITLAPPGLAHQATRADLAGCPRIMIFKYVNNGA